MELSFVMCILLMVLDYILGFLCGSPAGLIIIFRDAQADRGMALKNIFAYRFRGKPVYEPIASGIALGFMHKRRSVFFNLIKATLILSGHLFICIDNTTVIIKGHNTDTPVRDKDIWVDFHGPFIYSGLVIVIIVCQIAAVRIVSACIQERQYGTEHPEVIGAYAILGLALEPQDMFNLNLGYTDLILQKCKQVIGDNASVRLQAHQNFCCVCIIDNIP